MLYRNHAASCIASEISIRTPRHPENQTNRIRARSEARLARPSLKSWSIASRSVSLPWIALIYAALRPTRIASARARSVPFITKRALPLNRPCADSTSPRHSFDAHRHNSPSVSRRCTRGPRRAHAPRRRRRLRNEANGCGEGSCRHQA